MKQRLTLIFFSFALLFVASPLSAQIDTAAVIAKYYKDHGWGGVYQAAQGPQVHSPVDGHDHGATPTETAPQHPMTNVQWTHTVHDYGQINNRDTVSHRFTFKNTGAQPLYVEDVKPACGCTKGAYSKDPIPPGGEGFVELKFSPVGKVGIQNKSATVVMNTEPKTHQLTFQADIKTE